MNHFELVHEKLMHMFIVSQDLEYFIHDHPVAAADGNFQYSARLPKAGMYRVLADYYPSGGTPQLTAKMIFVPGGALRMARLAADSSPKHTNNMDVELVTEPAEPIAGFKTMLFFRVKPAEGLEQYLGAWGHMLAASDDLIDLIHTHPFLARWRPADPVQRDFSARANVSHLGAIPAEGRGQYGGIYRAGVGAEMTRVRLAGIAVFAALASFHSSAHDVITTQITFSREISRLMYSRCVSCHREGGSAFSLVKYEEARPWAKAIKEEVLERRMPPWGAVKGFGEFRDDRGPDAGATGIDCGVGGRRRSRRRFEIPAGRSAC